MDALLHISQPMYELVGLSAQRKEEALSRPAWDHSRFEPFYQTWTPPNTPH